MLSLDGTSSTNSNKNLRKIGDLSSLRGSSQQITISAVERSSEIDPGERKLLFSSKDQIQQHHTLAVTARPLVEETVAGSDWHESP